MCPAIFLSLSLSRSFVRSLFIRFMCFLSRYSGFGRWHFFLCQIQSQFLWSLSARLWLFSAFFVKGFRGQTIGQIWWKILPQKLLFPLNASGEKAILYQISTSSSTRISERFFLLLIIRTLLGNSRFNRTINHESTNETASISQRPSVPEPNCNFPIFRARVGFQNEAAWMHGNGDWPKLVVTTRYHFSKSQSSALLCSFLDSITNRKNVTWQAQWEEGQVYDKIQLVFLSKTYLNFKLDYEGKFHLNNEKLATDQNWDASTF